MISRSRSKLGFLEPETRSPGQIKGNLDNILGVTFMKSSWIFLKMFVLMILCEIKLLMTYISRSSDFLRFVRLGKFFSNN